VATNLRDFAKVPVKGWNSWDSYGASVTENEVRANAEYMGKNLKQYGWDYVTVDIQWYEPTASSSVYHDFYPLVMDDFSRLIPDEKRFPSAKDGSGFKKLADYVHGLGLKFGIHIMRGIPRQAVQNATPILGTSKTARDIALNNICPWNSDMYGVNMGIPEGQMYYDSIVDMYASWGVDLIKCDDIAYSPLYDESHSAEIEGLRRAIDKCGRQIVLSLSPGPARVDDGAFLQKNANMWRLTDDFWDKWELLLDMFERCEKWAPFSRPGNWPDCDMLPLGHIGLRSSDGPGGDRWTRFTKDEQKTMLSLWSLMQSPLILGCELTDLDKWTTDLISNRELIEIDDKVTEKYQSYRDDKVVVWKAVSESKKYFGLFNISNEVLNISGKAFEDFGVPLENMWDIWKHSTVSLQSGVEIPIHGVLLLSK